MSKGTKVNKQIIIFLSTGSYIRLWKFPDTQIQKRYAQKCEIHTYAVLKKKARENVKHLFGYINVHVPQIRTEHYRKYSGAKTQAERSCSTSRGF